MDKRVVISNSKLCVEFSTLGAELRSIKKDGKEYLWQGDPIFWNGTAPILFPICGSLKDNKFRYKDKEYSLDQHGFAKHCIFGIESAEEDKAVFILRSDEKSKMVYPFDFELRVIYELSGGSLNITYNVINPSDGGMYFSIGAHEGWRTPNGIGGYVIEFEKDEELLHTVLDGTLITHNTVSVGKGRLELDYKYFADDALVFLGLKSDSVILRDRKTSEGIKVSFGASDALLLWTIPEAEFICIEPWFGMPDYNDFHGGISEKSGMIKLPAGDSCTREHRIEFV